MSVNINTTPFSSDDSETGGYDGTHPALLTIYILIALLGVIGNGLVIFVLFRVPSLRSFTNVLISNQSVIDFTSSIFFFFLYVTPRPKLPVQPQFAMFVCKFWYSEYPLWAISVASTVNLVCLTVERYFAVIHPLKYRNRFTIKRARLLCLLPWIIGLLHEIPWMMVHQITGGLYLDENNNTIDTRGCWPTWPEEPVGLQKAFGCIVFIDHYLVPLSIMMYVYIRIVVRLRADMPSLRMGISSSNVTASRRENKDGSDVQKSSSVKLPSQPRRRFAIMASRSVLKTMVIVSLAYLICWGPNEVLYLVFNLGVPVDFTSVYYYTTVLFVLCNMCLNPIIYAFHYGELRRGVILACHCCARKIPVSSRTTMQSRSYSLNANGSSNDAYEQSHNNKV
ncbi:somatostatin receptor type 2-like [Lytechinus pictus]|uniref:somatostatin receptor type 2-like n=1 Tax=Lytechinus pictus TaxID=7653 RepID=UPI0030BA23FA